MLTGKLYLKWQGKRFNVLSTVFCCSSTYITSKHVFTVNFHTIMAPPTVSSQLAKALDSNTFAPKIFVCIQPQIKRDQVN